MPKLNETQQKELEQMRDWILAILEFSARHTVQNPIVFEMAATATRQTYERGSLSGMRIIFRDIKEMATGMSAVQYAELKEELMKKFGEKLL